MAPAITRAMFAALRPAPPAAFGRLLPFLPALALLAGCGGGTPVASPGSRPAPPPRFAPAKPLGKGLGRGHAMPHVLSLPGLEGVIGADARGLVAQFGPARLDVHEGEAQKLQFAGEACVLDVYLYPGEGGGPARATYVDARRASDGRDVDRAGCVAALKRR